MSAVSLVVGKTTEPRIPTSHFDDESGRCSVSGGCEVCRNSPQSTAPFTITSTRNAPSSADRVSRNAAPPHSPSGVNFARPDPCRGRGQSETFLVCLTVPYNPTLKRARNGILSPVEFERQFKTQPKGVWKTQGYSVRHRCLLLVDRVDLPVAEPAMPHAVFVSMPPARPSRWMRSAMWLPRPSPRRCLRYAGVDAVLRADGIDKFVNYILQLF